ncbi:PP2C family serine/threonine-protein phosphatase [Actinoplanes sp. CA-252034]|uniref:PP2C family serine/threonine-protein phosphatase n=1 Tax=Actinoplanes sp. CA-252034 TaxID=3239906 RepID=UPI003D974211
MPAAEWKVLAASVTGGSHRLTGAPCQDASGWRAGPGMICLAIADGAGSRPRSEIGSRAAVDAVLDLLDATTDPELATGDDPAPVTAWLREALAGARERLEHTAEESGATLDDYATTLAVALLTGRFMGLAQIGDALAVAGDADGYRTVQPPPRHEYANATTFLTASGYTDAVRLHVEPIDGLTDLVLSTDGLRLQILEDLAASTPYADFFTDTCKYARDPAADEAAIERFLTDMPDQSGDDKSLLIAVRVPEGPGHA